MSPKNQAREEGLRWARESLLIEPVVVGGHVRIHSTNLTGESIRSKFSNCGERVMR